MSQSPGVNLSRQGGRVSETGVRDNGDPWRIGDDMCGLEETDIYSYGWCDRQRNAVEG